MSAKDLIADPQLEDLSGYQDVPSAAGSLHPCQIKAGPQTGCMSIYDIRIPPYSFTSTEELEPGKSLAFQVKESSAGSAFLVLDDDVISLGPGDHFLVRPGHAYSLRNDGATDYVCLKMVLVHVQGSGAL